MQFGHVPLALAIATYDWNPKTAVFVVGMHFLPNADKVGKAIRAIYDY